MKNGILKIRNIKSEYTELYSSVNYPINQRLRLNLPILGDHTERVSYVFVEDTSKNKDDNKVNYPNILYCKFKNPISKDALEEILENIK
jgi:hypothetical protein